MSHFVLLPKNNAFLQRDLKSDMAMKAEIKKAAAKLEKQLIGYRRYLHMNPELSFKEKNTNTYIRSILDEYKIPYKSGYCKYGIVAEIKGAKKGKLAYLRGDMDALPIFEKNKVSYKSKNDGIMHACGHDVHTTCILGAAIILNQLKNKLKGTVRIVFQPGEEQLPGGASIMIKEGAIKDAKKAVMIGQHVHPPLEVGKVGFYPGEYMASADEIFIEVIGKGGHAALPKDFIDPIMISAHLLTNLHTIISRYSDPKVPSVLSFGKINSEGGATNVIPEKVTILGTFRTMDEDNRKHIHKVIRKVVKDSVSAFGAKTKLKLKVGYPTLYNNPDLTLASMDHAREYLGAKNVVMLDKRMTAEDFSYYSQMMPACFYRLGTGNKKKGIISPVHTPTFNIDEAAIKIGVGLMAFLASKQAGN